LGRFAGRRERGKGFEELVLFVKSEKIESAVVGGDLGAGGEGKRCSVRDCDKGKARG